MEKKRELKSIINFRFLFFDKQEKESNVTKMRIVADGTF